MTCTEILVRLDDGRVFTDMADDPANPCIACGACCTTGRVSFYQGELASLGGCVPDHLTVPVTPFLVCMAGTAQGGAPCVALRGVVGQSGIRCAIYAQRPSTCREFRAWQDDGRPDPRCSATRQRHGLAVLEVRPPA